MSCWSSGEAAGAGAGEGAGALEAAASSPKKYKCVAPLRDSEGIRQGVAVRKGPGGGAKFYPEDKWLAMGDIITSPQQLEKGGNTWIRFNKVDPAGAVGLGKAPPPEEGWVRLVDGTGAPLFELVVPSGAAGAPGPGEVAVDTYDINVVVFAGKKLMEGDLTRSNNPLLGVLRKTPDGPIQIELKSDDTRDSLISKIMTARKGSDNKPILDSPDKYTIKKLFKSDIRGGGEGALREEINEDSDLNKWMDQLANPDSPSVLSTNPKTFLFVALEPGAAGPGGGGKKKKTKRKNKKKKKRTNKRTNKRSKTRRNKRSKTRKNKKTKKYKKKKRSFKYSSTN